jgi:PHP family Zn ribbon phosphoesterase
VAAVQDAAGDALCVLAGMEITTAEEVHVLGLFPNANAAEAAAEEVAATLPDATDDDARRFGEQYRMDAAGTTIGHEAKLLAAASSLTLTDVVRLIHRHTGLAVAAHVNRPSFSVISQLGLIPPNAGFDALEVFTPPGGMAEGVGYAGYELPILASSDSHYLADVGSVRTSLELEQPSFDELAAALRGEGGRGVRHA